MKDQRERHLILLQICQEIQVTVTGIHPVQSQILTANKHT